MTAADAPTLTCAGVQVAYGTRTALAGVDLVARTGEFVALAGPNGSGKTTLLRAVLGFVPVTQGSISVLGTPVPDLSVRERARRIAWVPQEEGARDDVPLREYVLYGRYAHLRPLERESDADRASAERALAEVGLGDRPTDGILSLSGGERQRAVLARALVQDAPILLLDEPTAHLDIGHQLDLFERVRRLARRNGVTVVAAVHDLNLAARFADRIVVLSRGRKVADGRPPDVLSPELLERVWGIVAELRKEPRSGIPYLVPFRPSVAAAPPAPTLGPGPVHVVGGGGAASPVLRALVDAGYRVTAGVLNLLDTDQETAQELGVPTAVEVPFAPISAEARAAGRDLMAGARLIVVAPFPVGLSNLSNLTDVAALAGRIPVVLLARGPPATWDYAGGDGVRSIEDLRSRGVTEVAGVPDLLRACARILTPTAAPVA